jgi:hypothetical protein
MKNIYYTIYNYTHETSYRESWIAHACPSTPLASSTPPQNLPKTILKIPRFDGSAGDSRYGTQF